LLSPFAALGQTTAFTYQGRLTDSSMAANGSYDFQFALFDAPTSGTQQGTTQTVTGVTVASAIEENKPEAERGKCLYAPACGEKEKLK